jgi:hypothetical protein
MEIRRMTEKMAVIKIKFKNEFDFKKTKIVRIPIKISIIKVSLGILLRQYRHLPRRKRKENIGIRSLFCSSLLQEKQTDLPFKKDSPVLYRFAMTAIKLPKAAPNKNIKTNKK